MKKLPLSILAAAGLWALTPRAHAVATATATLTNLQYELFALSPSVLPMVTFANGPQVDSNATSDDYVTDDLQYAFGAIGAPLTVSSLQGANSASASTAAGDPTSPGNGPGATSAASAAGAGGVAYADGYALASSFALTPYTLLVITASTSGVGVTSTQLGEYASASASVELLDGTGAQDSYASAYEVVQTDGSSYSSFSPSVTASFVNLTGASLTGYAYAYASSATEGIAAVPEAQTSSLLLAGLAVVGALAVRRSAR